MKRNVNLGAVVILFALLTVTGCAGKSAQAANQGAGSSGPNLAPLTQDYENALPVLSQLVVGTFQLEDTEQAIEAEQAAALLPLWKAYRGMSGSTSSSPVEVQALVKQIRGGMTGAQLDAIAAMQLTTDDMMRLMQERGIEMTAGGSGANSAALTATRQAERPSIGSGGAGGPGGGSGARGGGGFPAPGGGGAPPAGGDPGMGGVPGGMTGMGTPGAAPQGRGPGGLAVPPPLYNALIDLLESKV